MRAVLQRVSEASVSVDGQVVGKIGRGLLIYLGVAAGDQSADIEYTVSKIATLRLFPGRSTEELAKADSRMNLSVGDIGGAILLVSQFTLCGDVRKGRRPSFDGAEKPAVARERYEEALASFRRTGLPVEAGVFQADMQVSSVNDGPVTFILDSRDMR
jgi:D-tyrosyl-tRNA(Tyr) deacylase